MNPWSMRFIRGIIAIALIVQLHQARVAAQTETTQPKSDSEAVEADAAKSEADAAKPEATVSARRSLAIEEAFENLRHKKFGVRQAATQHLANAGLPVLPRLEASALTGDVDFQNKCISIISAIGQKMSALDQAVAALERLSNDPSFNLAGKAAEELSRLKKHQVVRAIRLLKEAGVQVNQNTTSGEVYYVRNLTRNEQCEHLKHFPSLSSLTLHGSGVTKACIESLSKLPNLRQIYLYSTNISPQGIAELKLIPNFTSLSIWGNYSVAHIKALAEVKQLSTVHFYSPVGDKELIAAATLQVPQLSFASFSPSANTAEIIGTAKANKLQFSLSNIQNDDLKWLSGSKPPPLNININNSKDVTDDGIRFLENANIATLSLYNTGITAKSMKQIGTLKNLQSLMITNSPIDDESLKHLSDLQQLGSLRLQGTKVTGEGMATLKENLKNLRYTSPAPTPKKPVK